MIKIIDITTEFAYIAVIGSNVLSNQTGIIPNATTLPVGGRPIQFLILRKH
jgi:hypothetical protein